MEIQTWRELLEPYDLAVDELIIKFNHMIKEYQERGVYCPMQRVTGRVKSISSILDKMMKKSIAFEEITERIEDLSGIRIICQFTEDIEKVAELIAGRRDMRVKSEKNYVTTPKRSGYQSYHMIIYYTVHSFDGPKEILVEIQIRTMAMNFWSTIEHSLQYKYKQNLPEDISKKLKNASRAVIALDEEMSTVRSEVLDVQSVIQQKEMLVTDILNNIQNLYQVANKREILKIQEEFYAIYAMDNLEKLQEFAKELDLISEGYMAQSLS